MRTKRVRATGNNPADNCRRFNSWAKERMSEQKKTQKEAAEYIGMTQPEFSDKINGRRGGFSLMQAMGIVDYLGESQRVKELF